MSRTHGSVSRGGLRCQHQSLCGSPFGTQGPRRCRRGRACPGRPAPAAPAGLVWGVPSRALPKASAAGEKGQTPRLLRVGLQSRPGQSLVSHRFCQHAPTPLPPRASGVQQEERMSVKKQSIKGGGQIQHRLSLSAAGPELGFWLQPRALCGRALGRGDSSQTPPSSGCVISYEMHFWAPTRCSGQRCVRPSVRDGVAVLVLTGLLALLPCKVSKKLYSCLISTTTARSPPPPGSCLIWLGSPSGEWRARGLMGGQCVAWPRVSFLPVLPDSLPPPAPLFLGVG